MTKNSQFSTHNNIFVDLIENFKVDRSMFKRLYCRYAKLAIHVVGSLNSRMFVDILSEDTVFSRSKILVS